MEILQCSCPKCQQIYDATILQADTGPTSDDAGSFGELTISDGVGIREAVVRKTVESEIDLLNPFFHGIDKG